MKATADVTVDITVTAMLQVTPMVAVTITATAMTTIKLTVTVDRSEAATNGNVTSLTAPYR